MTYNLQVLNLRKMFGENNDISENNLFKHLSRKKSGIFQSPFWKQHDKNKIICL